MTRAVARAHFTSAGLIRLLADHQLIDAAAPRAEFADRLGQWLGFADAMALFAAHAEPVPVGAGAGSATAYSPLADCELARKTLTEAITQSMKPGVRRARVQLPEPPLDLTDPASAHEPYRRFHLAHQREMEQTIRALRERLRTALVQASPELARLARLDAVFDNALGERESRLLTNSARLLQRRFVQRLGEQPPAAVAADSVQTSEPGWLAPYLRDLEEILLAELDLRLQPALGLAEAFSNQKDALS